MHKLLLASINPICQTKCLPICITSQFATKYNVRQMYCIAIRYIYVDLLQTQHFYIVYMHTYVRIDIYIFFIM